MPHLTLEELRIELSAAKARGYFEQHGRGLLHTRPLEEDETPLGRWMIAAVPDMNGRMYENRYLTLGLLKTHGAPPSTIRLVETYDPETQAVVAIQFDLDDYGVEPHVVTLGPR